MQTSQLFLVSGIHRLFPDNEAAPGPHSRKGTTAMAKTAAIGFAPNTPLFARLLASIDRALMASARISLRNGDLPRFGL
jgi:hypothetical protein